SATGGTPDYTFTLDETNSVTQTSGDYSFTGLAAGDYTIDVKDANNCPISQINVSVTEPAILDAAISFIEPLCFNGSDGSITVNATGGTPDYTFTLDGSTSATQTSGNFSFTGLAAGDYFIDVKDANNCSITTVDITITQPAVLSGTTSFTEPSCKGDTDGTATVVATGGTPPYTYFWDDPGNQVTATATNLPAGSYIITVTDANNCLLALPSVTITEPDLLVISETHNNIKCNSGTDGDIDIAVAGGTTPYTYGWSNGATSQNISSLAAGTYTIDVTDANGCTAQISIELSTPTLPPMASC
ncbi:MAG: SprB repeat-containing protein, partial [Proteobacteria bacterium]|nr:SprB repeat-containing protein [Pseudomonadota bacterium]